MISSTDRAGLIRGISAAALAVALVTAVPALAQSNSTIRGRVEGAPAGTVVKVTDLTTGQVINGRTNANGTYTIPGVRPSTYRVETEGKPTQQIVVPVGQIITVDMAAPAADADGAADVVAGGAASGDIVVTGRRTQEVRNAEVATNISQQQIESLPQSDRNFLNFAALAPGVAVSPGGNGASRQVQAGGIAADNINVFIDGLSLKNQINHGGVAGQNFSPGNPFPQLAVQEFKVDTQNFKAEYEQAGSAIITAVTKSGGTEFHGTLFGEWQPKAFLGRPYFDRPGNVLDRTPTPKPDYDRKQYGGDFGGPIIKDKLHFYAAFEATDQKLPSTAVLLDTTNDNPNQSVPQAIANEFNGSYPQAFNQKLYFGKLTAFVTEADTVNLSGFFRRESNLAGFGGTAVPSHGGTVESKIDLYQLEWAHRGDSWLNEATVAYNTVFNGTPRATSGPEIILGIPGGEVAQLGAAGFEQTDNQKTLTFKNNVTFFSDAHVVKAGVKVSFNDLARREDNISNGKYYFQPSLFTSFDASTPTSAQIAVVPVETATAKDTQIGLFIQDDWTVNDHLTINAGIRWDYETNAKNDKYVTPDAVATALRNYQPWQAAGIDANDYISTGDNRKPYWKAFQPRVGVSYDLYGDRDTVFFAGAGRYYDRPLFITAGIESIKALYQKTVALTFCDGGNGQPTCDSVRGQAGNNGVLPPATLPYSASYKDVETLRAAAAQTGVGGELWVLNNDTKLPYSDQFNFGFRKRLGGIQTAVTFSYIQSRNIFKYVRGNRLPDGSYTSQGDQWIEDIFPAAGILPGYSGKLNIGSNDGKANYAAVYFTAEKPFVAGSKWGFTSTLTVQSARSNLSQGLQGDEVFNAPRIGVYGFGAVPGVEKWRFVGTAIARGPFDTVASVTGTFSSGPSFGNVIFKDNPPEAACCYANFNGVFWPGEIVGYANVDARIAKTFTTPWGHDLEVNFAAFNIFDSVNRNYEAWGAGSGANPTKKQNTTVGNARSFQVGAKYKF